MVQGLLPVFITVTSVSDLPAEWDAHPGFAQLGFQRGYLQAVERFDRHQTPRRYFLTRTADGAMAAAQGVELGRESDANPLLDIALGRFARSMPASRHLLPPTLLLQAPLSNDSPLDSNGDSADQRTRALDQLLTHLEDYARSRGLALAMTGVQDAHAGLIGLLRARGYASTPSGATTVLEADWTSWDGYLKHAGRFSRNAPSAIRREVNATRRGGMEIRRWDPAREPGAPLQALLDGHWQRYTGACFPYTGGFLEQLQAGLGDRLQVLVAYRGEEPVGLSTFFTIGRYGYQPFVGIQDGDKGQGQGRNGGTGSAYFNLMFYEPIRRAMELDIQRMYLGSTSYPAKIRRGCQVRPTWLFLAVQRLPVRWLMQPLVSFHGAVMRRKHGPLIRAGRFSTVR